MIHWYNGSEQHIEDPDQDLAYNNGCQHDVLIADCVQSETPLEDGRCTYVSILAS